MKGRLRENLISSLQSRQFLQPHISDPPQQTLTNISPLSPLESASENSPRYAWTLHKYTKSPSIVSHRGTPIPVDLFNEKDSKGRQSSIRQFIVRIDSIQSFVPIDADGNEIPEPDDPLINRDSIPPNSPYHTTNPIPGPDERPLPPAKHSAREVPVREYLLLQKMVKLGEETDWGIWGSATETSLDERGPSGWEFVFEGKGVKGYHTLNQEGYIVRDKREIEDLKRQEGREGLEKTIDKERAGLSRRESLMQGKRLGWLSRLWYGGGTTNAVRAVDFARKASEDRIKSIQAQTQTNDRKKAEEEKKPASLNTWIYGSGVETPQNSAKKIEARPDRVWLTQIVDEQNRKLERRLQAKKRVVGGKRKTPAPA